MHDTDMTPSERDLARRIVAYSDIDVASANSLSIARDAMASRKPGGLRLAWASLRPQVRLGIAVALLGAVLVGTLIVGSQLLDRRLAVQPQPDPSSAAPGASPQLDASLEGTWLATKPDALAFTQTPGPATLTLTIDANATHVSVFVPPVDQAWLFADVEPAADGLRFVSKTPSNPVALDDVELAGCPAGDAGTYRVDRSSDGLFLTVSVVSDSCASRSAVLERTWVHSVGHPNSGGPGVVTGVLNQPFLVAIPEGSYAIEPSIGAITVVQTVPELQFLAFLDPQGFNDPCDVTAGRFEIEPGADAFVAYFRQLDGFTVDSTSELRVDGHRAVQLVVHANPDAGCPSGARLTEWQPKLEETLGRSWFLRPGDTDSLIIVELPGSTVMFEVLPAPNPLEDEVIGSIRFLNELPTSP